MSDTLEKIRVVSPPSLPLVSSHVPADFSLDVKKWFKTETCTIDFGEYTGPYGTVGALRASVLNPMFAQGWYITKASEKPDSDQWKETPGKKVVRSEVHSGKDTVGSKGDDTTTGKVVTEGEASNESESKSGSRNKYSSESKSGSEAGTLESGVNYASSEGKSKGDSQTFDAWGTSKSKANSKSTDTYENHKVAHSKTDTTEHGHNIDTTTETGDPYYCSKAIITLELRILDNQTAINELAKSFVDAYNDGKQINVDRYEELVNLYATVVSRTEDELNNIRPIAPEDLREIIDGVVRDCKNALDLFRDKVGEIPDAFGDARIEEINRKFTKLLEETRSRLITQGLYNGTVWPTTESGIKRDWEIALNDLMDELVQLRIDAYGKIASLTCDIGGKVIDVLGKFREIVDMFIKLTEVRNDIFVKMCTFMEKREDTYPGAETIGAGVSKLALQTGAVY